MAIPKYPLRGMCEQTISIAPDYDLSVCVYLPTKKKVLFITEPVDRFSRGSRAIMGLLALDSNALSSMLTEWHPTSRVTSVTLCSRGLVSCSRAGLILVNFKTGTYEILARCSRNNTCDRILGVATHPDHSLWFTYLDPVGDSNAKIYIVEPKTNRLVEVNSDSEHKPVRIAISPDGRRCYTACSVHNAIYVYDIGKNHGLHSRHRISYVPVENLSSLKVDREGFVYASCGSELKCWDRYGHFTDVMRMSESIKDFTFTGNETIVMFRTKWVRIERDPNALTARRLEKSRYSRLEGRFSRL